MATTGAKRISLSRIVGLCCAGGFIDGYDLLVMGGALLLLEPHFGLTGTETGLITALPYIGAAIGALTAGRLNDKIGRRIIYMFDVALFFVLAVLLGFAQTVWQLAVLRFVVGLAIGFDMPTGSSMIAEFSPPRLRGALTGMMNTAWLFGGSVAAFVGYLFYQTGQPEAWRWMFASAAVPALVVLVLRSRLPESPYWLRSVGKHDEAAAVELRLPVSTTHREAPKERRGSFREVIKPGYRTVVAFFAVYWLWQAFFSAAPFTYTALIFKKLINLPGATSLLLSGSLMLSYVVFSLLCQFLILDRLGRKTLAVGSCAIAGFAGIPVALLQHSPVYLIIFFFIALVATQMATIPFWPWSVEQLPTRIRATGQSIGSAGNKIGLFGSLLLFPPSVIAAIGWAPMFFAFVVGFLGLALFAALLGKETKGNDLATLDSADSTGSTPIGVRTSGGTRYQP